MGGKNRSKLAQESPNPKWENKLEANQTDLRSLYWSAKPESLKTQNPNASQNRKRSKTKMAKSLRSKREKRLRAIRREIVEPLYETKDAAKLAAQEAALAAPKVPVRLPPSSTTTAAMDLATTNTDSTSAATTFSFNAMGALSLSHTHFDLKLFDQILFFFFGGIHCFETKWWIPICWICRIR